MRRDHDAGPRGARSQGRARPLRRRRRERLVREAFSIYERGAPQLRAIRNEPGVHPSVAEAGERLEASLGALIDAARITRGERAVVRAMIDLGTWQALRDQGLGPEQAVRAMSGMLAPTAAPRSGQRPRLRR
jgi:hypothetical protein